MIFRVSHVEMFRKWMQDQDSDLSVFIDSLRNDEPTPAKLKGTAFHKALELACEGDLDEISADGYTFRFDGEFRLYAPQIREVRHQKNYGGIAVSGRSDCISGALITDYKSTEHFDAERYLTGYEWCFYLDIFRANTFRWNVFEMHEVEASVYVVTDLHVLEQYRYPDMEQDCRALAHQLRDFALQYLPRGIQQERPWEAA